MNILNYKWSAFAAASLHGALLILSPTTPPTIRTLPDREDRWTPFPPIDQPVVVDPADVPAEATDKKSGGENVADLPEDPVPPLIDNGLTQKPQPYERTPTGPLVEKLNGIHGFEPGDGPGTGRERIQGTIPDVTKLDRIPRATVQPSPRYPDTMKKDGVTGSVIVEFFVDASGRVYRAEARKFTHVGFVEPAVRAVLQWRFEPGRRNDRPVPFKMAVPVEFGLGAN